MTDSDTEVRPGQILAGKYRIEEVLGKGGMGVVVAATHLQLDERVALKFLLPEALANAEAVRRFEREARAAVKIKSEHVARVTDVGTLDTGSPYMVMEYLSGLDLGQYLERRGVLPPDEAAEYLLQACEAIAEAHSLGIIHRDLKPANLFRIVRTDGTPSIKVLDFGISKVIAEGSMTQTSSMMGSPYYMSPEQMTSARSVDARTDVWALGVIFHELLTGRVPYEGQTIPEICVQILHAEPPAVSSLRSGLPPEVDQIVTCALAKDREARYPDVGALARALAPLAPRIGRTSSERISRVLGMSETVGEREQRPTPADGTGGEADPTAKTTLAGASHTQTGVRGRGRRPLVVAVLAFVVAGGIGTLVLLGFGDHGSPAADETAEVAAVPGGVESTPDREERAAAELGASPARPESNTLPRPAEKEREHDPRLAGSSKKEVEKTAGVPDSSTSAASPVAPSPAAASSAAASSASPSPAAASPAARRPVARPTAAPAPRPQVAPRPAPEPARKSAPAKPSTKDLFMDRK